MTAPDRKLFSMVELEVNRLCNRRCTYCPNGVLGPRDQHLPEFMPEAVLERIIAELERLEFAGRLSFHFYNEPLLHPELDRIAHRIHERLPAVRLVLYSNGDLLSDDWHAALRAAGISRFIVTSHDGTPIPARPDQVVLYDTDLGITNRGGMLGAADATVQTPCFAPASMLIMGINGDVLLCYEDARRAHVMGNVMSTPLDELWFAPEFDALRTALASGNRDVTPICRACDNTNHQTPEPFDFVP